MLLVHTTFHRHDGLIIMATNRPYDLDEAMHRRIMIAVEFRQPDHLLRKAIWESHVPKEMKLADDINLVRKLGSALELAKHKICVFPGSNTQKSGRTAW